ncbi:unnamed protein product [Gadus morhua 'NCC']
METPDQGRECYTLWIRLQWKWKTPKQERKFDDGAAGEGTSGPSSTSLLSPELPAGLETSIPPAPSSETQPAGLETSIPPAPSSETQPAGLETSIPPAPSSETQPAEETTPLMSSESPAPTGDQQEHTSRTTTPDVTMDGHDDDQSLGPEDDVIRRDISASQSTPSTSQSTPPTSQSSPSTSQSIPFTSQSARRSGAGERDIEMGPIQGSDP